MKSFGKELYWFILASSQGAKHRHTLAETLHTSIMIGPNEHKVKETIYVIHLVISLQAVAAPAIATRTDRWIVCT